MSLAPVVTEHWAAIPGAQAGLGSQQGSPWGPIWMRAAPPPAKMFLSKYRPGSQAARLAEPLPGSVALTRACHCSGLCLRTTGCCHETQSAKPTREQPFGIAGPSSLLTMVMANLCIFN